MPTSVPTSAASSAPSSTSSVGDGSTGASSMPIANVAQTSSSLETGSPRSLVQGNVLVTPSGPATASLRNQSTAHLAEDGSSTAASASASASVPQGDTSEPSSPEHRVLLRVKRSSNSTSTSNSTASTTDLSSTTESSTASTVELTSSSSSSSTGVSSSTAGSSSSTTTNTTTITSTPTITNATVAAQQSTSSNSTNGTTATQSPSSRLASTLSLNTTRSSSLPVSSTPTTSPLLNTTSSGLLPTSSTGAPISSAVSSATAIGVGVATGFIGIALFIGLIYWCYAKYQEYRMHRGREVTLRWRSLHPRRHQPRATESVVEMQPLSASSFLAAQGGFSRLGDNNVDPQLVAFINELERQARQDEAQGARGGNSKKKKGAKDDKSKKKH